MRILLSSKIYPRECVGESIAAFAEFCSVNIGREQNKNYSIEIIPGPTVSDEEGLTNEFLNNLLAVAIEDHFIYCAN